MAGSLLCLVWLPLCFPGLAIAQRQDVWFLGMSSFTGNIWDVGESARFAANMMVDLINQEQQLLPGYQIRILWQDDRCSDNRSTYLLMYNMLLGTYLEVPTEHTLAIDTNKDGRMSDSEIMDDQVNSSYVMPSPVAILNCGCSIASSAIVRWAWRFRLPIVSGTNTRPDLSNRAEYPNYFRVIAQEGEGPLVVYGTMKMLGLSRVTVAVGDSTHQKDLLYFYVTYAQSEGITIVGRQNLSALVPDLKGAQLSSESWPLAQSAIRLVKESGARAVIAAMLPRELNLMLCAQAKERSGTHSSIMGLVWFSHWYDTTIWLEGNLANAPGADCTPEDVLSSANGLFVYQAAVWRQDRLRSMSCFSSTTVDAFRTKFFEGQGAIVGSFDTVPLGNTSFKYNVMREAPVSGDALCMHVLALRELLFVQNVSLADLAEHTPQAYNAYVDVLSSMEFEGIQGTLRFIPGRAEPIRPRYEIYQLQAVLAPCAGAGLCGLANKSRVVPVGQFQEKENSTLPAFQTLEQGELQFHFQGEVYPLPGAGAGAAFSINLDDFVDCDSIGRAGSVYNPVSKQCEKCSNTSVYVEKVGCLCKPGHYRNGDLCLECSEGHFSSRPDQNNCEPCAKGKFAGESAMSECRACGVGRYADSDGTVECRYCPDGGSETEGWTTMVPQAGEGPLRVVESTTAANCGCDVNRRNVSGRCKDCEEGLDCRGINYTTVKEGYYSEETISVFKCRGKQRLRCQGGLPGDTCKPGRLGIACSECERGKAPVSDGSCEDCSGSHAWQIILACVVCFGGLTLVYLILSRPASRSNEFVNIIVFSGLLLTAMQVFSVVGTFQLTWREPLLTAMSYTSLLSINLDYFRIGCVTAVAPLTQFAVKVSVIFVAFIWLTLVHCSHVLLFHGGRFAERRYVLKCVLGTVLMALYISVVSAVLSPLQCEDHPNGKRTVREYPGVLCWEEGDHRYMVIIGIIAFLLIPVPHIVRSAIMVWQFPMRMRIADSMFLQENSFLFIRFRPGAYWYCQVIFGRSLLCAALLVPPNVVAQLTLLQLVMTGSLLCGVHFRAWKTHQGNLMEIVMFAILVSFCSFTSVLSDDRPQDLNVLAYLCTAMIVAVAVPFPLYALAVTVRKMAVSKRRFQFFLCHHKAGAGAFTRLLKQTLLELPTVTREVFVDSDNLENLTSLFDLVATHTETLVIIASHNVFRRPWCVGEMTTTRLNKLKAMIVAMPDMEMPTPAFIEDYADQVSDLDTLTAEGISLEAVQETLQWTHTLERLELKLPISRERVLDLATLVCSGKRAPQRGLTKRFEDDAAESLLLCDPTNLEAVAAALVLQKMLGPHLLEQGFCVPTLLPQGADLPDGALDLLVLLSGRLFEQDWVLTKLVQAAQLELRVLLVTLDDTFRFPSKRDIRELQEAKGDSVAGVVVQTFKGISVSFQPQHASLNTLQLGAKEVARRLSAPRTHVVTMTPVQKSVSREESTVDTSPVEASQQVLEEKQKRSKYADQVQETLVESRKISKSQDEESNEQDDPTQVIQSLSKRSTWNHEAADLSWMVGEAQVQVHYAVAAEGVANTPH